MAIEPSSAELKMDAANLYREDVFTDAHMGSIRMMTPVKSDGALDPGRKILYVGEAQMLTPAGLLPLTFQIDATSLADAVEKFSVGARQAVERTVEELQQLRREASSSIIVPETLPPGGLTGGLRGPGVPRGGGKIQLP